MDKHGVDEQAFENYGWDCRYDVVSEIEDNDDQADDAEVERMYAWARECQCGEHRA